jgi:hypothetical protein
MLEQMGTKAVRDDDELWPETLLGLYRWHEKVRTCRAKDIPILCSGGPGSSRIP